MCAKICSLVGSFEELKGSAAECIDRLWFCRKRNKTLFVDVAPTLGVNHVISGVVVSCAVSVSISFMH